MKLFLILNEKVIEKHQDVRYALQRLMEENFISAYWIFPFLAYRDQGRSDRELSQDIYKTAKDFLPDLILWSHTGNLKIEDKLIANLRKLPSKPSIGYRDGDIYQRFYKPLPREVITLSKQCDVSFWPGYSPTIDLLKKNKCEDIRYVPLTTDESIFSEVRNGKEIKYDVVMIGNLVKSRIPFKTFPGSRFREQLARYFYKKLGSRFAVFGGGWKGEFAKGKIAFHQQNKIYHQSRLVLGVNNLHADYYFSNRIPIALSSGVLIVHNYEKGVEQIFQENSYPYFFRDKKEAWKISAGLLAKPQEELDMIAFKYREFVMEKLTMTCILKYMIEVLKDYKNRRDGNPVRFSRNNPWINKVHI